MDKLVVQRFEELETKAEAVHQTRKFDFRTPEGVSYFKIDYSSFLEWATNVLNLLQRVFGESSVHYQNFNSLFKTRSDFESSFEHARAVFRAAKEDFKGGYLFNLTGLVKAEVLSDSLEQATELLNAGYKDPACVLAGVSLEIALKDLCTREAVPHGKADRMNTDLCKAGKYNMAKQKQITAWAELRNKAAHGDWSSYNKADVEDFVQGVKRFVADYL